jgi:hypothetical protein
VGDDVGVEAGDEVGVEVGVEVEVDREGAWWVCASGPEGATSTVNCR